MTDAPPRRPAKGELRLELEQTWHRPGEPIKGVVHLELTGATSARRLVVGLAARQRAVGREPAHGGLQLSYRNDKVYDAPRELDGARRYHPGEAVPFQLWLPAEAAVPDVSPEGPLRDEAARAAAALSEVKRFPLEWRVYALLDRPWHLSPRVERGLLLTAPASSPRLEDPEAPAPKTPRPKRKRTASPKRKRLKKPKR